MLKKIGIGFAVLIAIVAGASWYLFSNLDSYVKAAIEKYASEATKTAVHVEAVKISLSTGEGTITGLTVGNPNGYSSAQAVSVGTILMRLDAGSIRGSGPIIIKEISVSRPQVSYELKGDIGNLQVIQKNAMEYAGQFKSSSEARKEIIDDLNVKGGEVSATAPELQGKSLKLPLPAIHLRDIGKNTGGATPAQIADEVVNAVTREAEKAAAGALRQQITAMVGDKLGGTLPGAAADTGNIGNQVKGLFGK